MGWRNTFVAPFSCLLLSTTLLCGTIAAQVIPRNILQKNCPSSRLQKVLVSRESFLPWPRDPEDWKKALPDTVLQQLVRVGEEALKANFPNVPATVALDFLRTGNRTRYEMITFAKRNRLWELILAESIEGQRRFLDAIVNDIWSICEESFWGSSAHLFLQKSGPGLPDIEEPVVDLFAAETAANLALADFFIGKELDSVSVLIRRRIHYEVNRRIFAPLLSVSYDWMGKGDQNAKLNNWAPWIMSNYLTAVLLLEDDAAKRIQCVEKVMHVTDQYLNGFGDDGGCEEGPHYWANGPGCVFDILNLLYVATNGSINIYSEKLIRNIASYIYHTHISANYFVNVADSHPEENPEPIMAWRFGKAVADTNLTSFGGWLFRSHGLRGSINPSFHRMRTLFDVLSITDLIADKHIFHESPGSWWPDLQLMTARLSNGLFIAAHGGNNGESHNHNDVGDFIVYANGDPVIVDVGAGLYTARTFSKHRYELWFNSSAYHNLPTINNAQQVEGIAHAATNVVYKNSGEQTNLSMDIAKAYPANIGLKSWQRTIAVQRETIAIKDKFESKEAPSSLTQTFMTVCNVDLGKPGIIIFATEHGTWVALHYDTRWQVKTETIRLTTEEDQGIKNTWRGRPITRILFSYPVTGKGRTFEYRITVEEK